MAWASFARPALQRWRVTGGLAVASLLPDVLWRFLPEFTASLINSLDVLAVGAVVAPTVAGLPRLGLTFAWLLFGYLTYQYTSYLYPDEFAAVVDYRGFRLLTALGTLYFGLVLWGSVVPETVPLQVLPISSLVTGKAVGLVALSLLASVIGCGVAFGVYFTRWHPEALYDEQSDLRAFFDQFFAEDAIDEDALPGRWAAVYRWLEITAYSMLPGVVCVLVGFVGTVLNLFYPLPEAVLVVGLVALRIADTTSPTSRRAPTHEMDLRLLDSVSGATRNFKGAMMLLVGFLGALMSALIFTISLTALVEGLASSGGNEAASTPVPVWLAGLFVVTLVVSTLLMGGYSLIHWVRQFERIEPYARLWERDGTEGAAGRPADDLPTRPPGLLAPAHLPVVGLIVTAILTTNGLPVMGFVPGVALLTIAIVVMGWGLVQVWREERQPLARESRDLLVTTIGQLSIIFLMIGLDPGTFELDATFIVVSGFATMALISLVYLPDVADWKSSQQGARKLLGEIPTLLLVLSLVGLVRYGFEGPTLLIEAVLFFLVAFLVFSTVLEIYLERVSR